MELLHALADDDHSQLMRGILRVRQLPEPTANSSKELAARTEEILSQAAVGLEEKLASHTGHQTELAELAGAVTRANAGITEWANQLEQALLET